MIFPGPVIDLVSPVIFPHGVVGCIENAIAVEVAAGWINRQDAHRVRPCLIQFRVPVGFVVGVVISAGLTLGVPQVCVGQVRVGQVCAGQPRALVSFAPDRSAPGRYAWGSRFTPL